ncbi:MAG: serine/threonine-protein kinase, partial [Planctomycetota bacterium]
ARVSDDSSKKHLTQIGITMGTPLYMSPEQVEGKPVDVRSDIYSLGVTTYHMLSGAPPFDGDNALSIAIQHVKNEALPLDEIRPDLPKPLIELVQQMMAKNPADRPSSASQLLKQIKQIKIASDEDWEQLVETLAIGSSTTKFNGGKTETRLAATRNLQNVMSGHIESWWMHRITLLSFVLLTLIGIATGYAFSKSFPIEDPLGVPIAIENSIPRRDNAKEQYELAIDLHPKDLESYKAVLNYHPVEGDTESKNQTKLYRDRSIERMAEIHLLASDFKKAQVLYSQLAANGYNTRFVIVGKAGLAVVNFHLGDHDKARDLVMQVESDAEKYLNQFLLQRFNSVRENYFANGSAVSLSN